MFLFPAITMIIRTYHDTNNIHESVISSSDKLTKYMGVFFFFSKFFLSAAEDTRLKLNGDHGKVSMVGYLTDNHQCTKKEV